jgi:PAS domain S-box-containing protein
VIVRLIRDAAGAAVCYEGTVVDSTARRLAEDNLRESEDRFRKIFLNSPLGMALVTPDFRFYSVNPAWVAMTGYSEAELLAMSFKDITHPDYLAGDMEQIRKLAAGTIPVYSTEKKYIRKDRSILHGFIRVVAIRDQQESLRYFAAQVEDITGRKVAEEQREELIKELAMKNSELDRFTYTVSHDLKSPLLGIRAYLSLMEIALNAGRIDEVREYIPRISTAALSLENLISTLLSLSRSGKVVENPARIPFTDLARQAAGMLDATLKERGVTLTIPDSLPVISGDRQRLLQVMINLLDNAVKFMGDQKEPSVVVGVSDDRETPVFFVKDNGMGIRQEDQSKVFGLFERIHTEIPGTGIGLATVKRIIEAHGGIIHVESDGPGKGTTFRFTLPGVVGEGDGEE